MRERLMLSSVYDAKLSPNGSLLYLVYLIERRISAFDTATRKVTWQVSLKDVMGYSSIGTDFGASPDGRFLYIPRHYGGNDIRPTRLGIVDVMRHVELPNAIQLPLNCQGEVLTPPTGNFIYIHCSNKLILINTTTHAIQHEYTLDLKEPVRALKFSPDGQWLYLFVGNNRLAIFDTAQHRVVRQVSFEPNPLLQNPLSFIAVLLAPSGDGRKLLVAQSFYEPQTQYQQAACLFRVFDTRTWRNVAEFKFPYQVFTVAVNNKGDAVYAAIEKTPAGLGKLVVPNTVVELSADSGEFAENLCARMNTSLVSSLVHNHNWEPHRQSSAIRNVNLLINLERKHGLEHKERNITWLLNTKLALRLKFSE
jgi:DNA-binding beta-propeller fold protein YncE